MGGELETRLTSTGELTPVYLVHDDPEEVEGRILARISEEDGSFDAVVGSRLAEVAELALGMADTDDMRPITPSEITRLGGATTQEIAL